MSHTALFTAMMSCVLPGAGQLRNGERAKGIAFLCMAVSIWFWLIMSIVGPEAFRSTFTAVVLGITYVFVIGPSASDAYRGATRTAERASVAVKTWYVIFMVMMVGAMSVPLVWQSAQLSRRARMFWSTLAIMNTLLALLIIVILGPRVERLLQELLVLRETMP